MNQWQPCKRRIFIKRLQKLGFEGPYSGTRHQFMVHEHHRLSIPSNSEYSIPQLRMMISEIELIINQSIAPNKWNNLAYHCTHTTFFCLLLVFSPTSNTHNRIFDRFAALLLNDGSIKKTDSPQTWQVEACQSVGDLPCREYAVNPSFSTKQVPACKKPILDLLCLVSS